MSALNSLTLAEVGLELYTARAYVRRLESAQERLEADAREAIGIARADHLVIIVTRYGETDRACYCTVTNGAEHHEHAHPWITHNGSIG